MIFLRLMIVTTILLFWQIPDPPECGNLKVEDLSDEECDCGKTHEECDDPCCYPLNITPEVILLKSCKL